MAKHFARAMCVTCGTRTSSPKGEHVWTEWFFKEFPVSEGPYTTLVGGKPVLRRDGQPRQQTSIPRVQLPMCKTCNGELDRRFEKAAKEIVRRVTASDAQVALTGQEAMHCALWFLKTWLFLAHPEVVDSEPGVTRDGWVGAPESLWAWTVDGAAPPDGLSLWVRRPTGVDLDVDKRHTIWLPTIVADGHETVFRAHTVGVRAGTSFLELTVVFHPGWPIDHPLEADGQALRLWPRDVADPLDFATIPATGPNDLRWLQAHTIRFAPGAYPTEELPALTSYPPDLMAVASHPGVASFG